MPQLGESMAEATVVAIKVQPGEKVAADQEIIEVETDKAVMGVTTPCPGEIAKIDAKVKSVYAVGTVLASVARTGRLLCLGESFPWGGATAEIIARVATEGFHLLDAAPARINAKDTPIPYHPNLWSEHRPNAKSIAAKARQILAE